MNDGDSAWKDEIKRIGEAYKQGAQRVEQRRASWRSRVESIILPALRQVGEALKAAGLDPELDHARYEPNIELVCLAFGGTLTGAWQPGGPPGMERPASLNYSLAVDGRVHLSHFEHVLDGFEKPEMKRIASFESADDITQDLVRKHGLEFVRAAYNSSYRGPRGASERAIGFVPPKRT